MTIYVAENKTSVARDVRLKEIWDLVQEHLVGQLVLSARLWAVNTEARH